VARTLCGVLSVDLGSLFRGRAVDTSFLTLFITASSCVAGSASGMKNKALRAAVGDALAMAALRYGQLTSVAAALSHLLGRHEHVAGPLAEWCEAAAKKQNDTRLPQALLKDIGSVPPAEYKRQAETDAVGVRNVCAFLVDLAERLPLTVGKNISLLRPHLDGDAPQLRCALVSVVGHLVVGYSDRSAANPLTALGLDGGAAQGASGASSQQSELRVAAKQGFLDVLFERAHDTNAFARARVLAVFSSLAEREVLGAPHFVACANVACGRLHDTKAAVRKQAACCLRTLLEKNPFGPELALEPLQGSLGQWQARLEEAQAKERSAAETQELEQAEREVAASQAADGADGDAAAETSNAPAPPPAPAASQPAEEDAPWLAGGVEGLRAMVASLSAAVAFAAVYAKSVSPLTQLLSSATSSDCCDAITTLVTCRQFGVDGAARVGVPAALRLVFSREATVRSAALEAAETLFLRQEPAGAAVALLELVHGASLGDLTAAEEVLTSLVSSGRLAAQGLVMRHLWAEAAGASAPAPGTATAAATAAFWQRRCDAVALLAMAGTASPDVVRPHVGVLLDCVAAGARQYAPLARAACAALSKAAPSCDAVAGDGQPALVAGRWQVDHAAFDALAAVLRAPVSRGALAGAAWFPVAEQALACVFARHPDPEAFAGAVLAHMAADAGLVAAPGDDQAAPSLGRINAASLARFLFALGCAALNQLVYIESAAKAVRNARNAAEKRAAEAASAAATAAAAAPAAPPAKGGRGKKTAAAAAAPETAPAAADKSLDEPGGLAAQLGQTSASVDAELDVLREAAESELVGSASPGVIALFAPLALGVASTPALLASHPLLRGAALSCLCRLCALDAAFCEAHLALVFTLLRDTPSPGQRASTCVSLGDLAFRFPNAVEPWTAHLYGSPQWKTCLHDVAPGVRKHALGVLSHLVLNDMLKVRGNVADMARCLEDTDPQVAALARLFFHELAQRTGAPIYNLLPDVLSRLSADASLSEESFSRIMKHLLLFVDKDKQTDGLVDKLLARMPDAIAGGHVKQQRDITLCVASLQGLSDKGVKRIMDSWKLYEAALGDGVVAAHLEAAVRGAKRGAKSAEAKSQMEEFEAKLRQAAEERQDAAGAALRAERHEGRAQGPPSAEEEARGADENAAPPTADVAPPAAGRGSKAAARGGRKAAGGGARKAPPRRVKHQESSGSEGDEDDDAPPRPAAAKAAPRQALRPARGAARQVVVDDSDDDA
jgi:condensin complex subunit 1